MAILVDVLARVYGCWKGYYNFRSIIPVLVVILLLRVVTVWITRPLERRRIPIAPDTQQIHNQSEDEDEYPVRRPQEITKEWRDEVDQKIEEAKGRSGFGPSKN
ncbi:hypothetical protein FRC02_002318 [Tulasnella sp. 418]|nr:hypothetical protein FRC02_002318 [Tulasnella sp. 418]